MKMYMADPIPSISLEIGSGMLSLFVRGELFTIFGTTTTTHYHYFIVRATSFQVNSKQYSCDSGRAPKGLNTKAQIGV